MLRLQYIEAEIDKKKDPRETKVDPNRPRLDKIEFNDTL